VNRHYFQEAPRSQAGHRGLLPACLGISFVQKITNTVGNLTIAVSNCTCLCDRRTLNMNSWRDAKFEYAFGPSTVEAWQTVIVCR